MAKKFLLIMSDSSSLIISKFPIPGAGTCSFHANKIAGMIVVWGISIQALLCAIHTTHLINSLTTRRTKVSIVSLFTCSSKRLKASKHYGQRKITSTETSMEVQTNFVMHLKSRPYSFGRCICWFKKLGIYWRKKRYTKSPQ